jgi:hypothetical protein
LVLDLILDGGVFNGSYLVGALYFLKEMERRHYIRIDQISGCSIGSICAFLYFIDALDMVSVIYEWICKDLKENHHLNKVKELGDLLREKIPDDLCEKINGKLYVTYYHVKKGKKIVKSHYKTKEEVIDVLIRSCFIPFLIDGTVLYKNKYVDGMNPHLLEKSAGKKRLFLDLFGYDKFTRLWNVKNEKSNFHRVLTGLLDIHDFFIKQSNTPMCSYVEEWGLTHQLHHQGKIKIEWILLHLIYLLLFIQTYVSEEIKTTLWFRFVSKVGYEFYLLLLETYTF